MALRNYTNSPGSVLASSILAAAGTLEVDSATWAPATPFIVVVDRATENEEVMLVTNVAGTTFTVTRGYDSTIAFDHSADATIEPAVAAIDLREANSHVNANGGVHGVGSAVVGAADTQTLTNKTIHQNNNSISGFDANALVTANASGVAKVSTPIPAGGLVGGDALAAATPPIGSIIIWATDTAPEGWRRLDGAAISRTTYADLYALLGTTYGPGDGTTTFNLPDCRDMFPRMPASRDDIGNAGGSSLIQTSQLPAHNHTIGGSTGSASVNHTHEIPNHSHSISYQDDTNVSLGGSFTRVFNIGPGEANGYSGGLRSGTERTTSSAGGSHSHTLPANTGSRGSGESYWQPYLNLDLIMRVL